jgi:hypothetical protein
VEPRSRFVIAKVNKSTRSSFRGRSSLEVGPPSEVRRSIL